MKGSALLNLLVFACILPVLAVMAWHQALAFDPCDNIFKRPGNGCLTSPVGGFVAGGFAMFIGGGIAQGALRNGRRALGNWRDAALMAWVGLCIAATGAAMLYAANELRNNPVRDEPSSAAVAGLRAVAAAPLTR
jgi:uncharacterized membrane protein YfcA